MCHNAAPQHYSQGVAACPQVYLTAARAIRFEPSLRHHAARVIRALRKQQGHYDGLHLRVELDAQRYYWHSACQGVHGCTQSQYLKTIAAVSQHQAVYIASGVFMRDAQGRFLLDKSEVEGVVALFAAANKTVYHSGSFLPAALTAQLNAEQLAAVDFMVLAQADSAEGFAQGSSP